MVRLSVSTVTEREPSTNTRWIEREGRRYPALCFHQGRQQGRFLNKELLSGLLRGDRPYGRDFARLRRRVTTGYTSTYDKRGISMRAAYSGYGTEFQRR